MDAIFHAQSESWIPQCRYIMRRTPNSDPNRIPHSHYAAYRNPNPIWIPQHYDVKCQNPNLRCSPNFSGSRRRKRSPPGMNPPNCRCHTRANLRREGSSGSGSGSPARNLIMGQVKILKRGEQLPSLISDTTTTSRESSPGSGGGYWNAEEMLVLCSTERLGPDPETVQKQIKLRDLSSFFVSPQPNSLPIPKFFGTKVKNIGAVLR